MSLEKALEDFIRQVVREEIARMVTGSVQTETVDTVETPISISDRSERKRCPECHSPSRHKMSCSQGQGKKSGLTVPSSVVNRIQAHVSPSEEPTVSLEDIESF
jgi:hypothetical protein